MKQIVFIGLALFIFTVNTFAQVTEQYKPDIRINVEKHFDDEGNVIGIDSTYQLSWSSSDIPMNMDSLFKSFGFDRRSRFHLNLPDQNDSMSDFNFDGLEHLFSFEHMDSLFQDRSFSFDFFENQDMSDMLREMNRLMRQNMDQFHRLFDDDHFEFFKIDPNSGDSIQLIQPKLKPGQKQI